MKFGLLNQKWRILLSLCCGLVLSQISYAQYEPPPPIYHIDERMVTLEFDLRTFANEIENPKSVLHDFKEVDLEGLIKAGHLENFSFDGWRFEREGPYLCRFVKKLDDFTEEISPIGKFLIDGENWVYPLSEAPEALDWSQEKAIINIGEGGNTVFYLAGFQRAHSVILSGSFNEWNEKELVMNNMGDGWELVLDLLPGIYEYKFIVDGHWITDPDNEDKVPNNFKTMNSILLVGEKIDFYVDGFKEAKEIYLSGSFNNWSKQSTPFKRYKAGWLCEVELPPGKHFYKLVIDGNWVIDPHNELTQRDFNGHLNSVLLVRKGG